MNVTLEDGGPCRKVLHISAPAESVRPEYQKVVAEIGTVAKVDGFRVGKAPLAFVERRYAKTIAEETRERLVPRLYREALKQENLTPVSIVSVGEVKLGREQGISFRVVVDIPPEFSLPRYQKIPLQANPAEVSDQAVDEAYGRILDRFARFEETAAHPVREGDLALIDYRGECDGKPVSDLGADAAAVGEGKDFWVMAGLPEFLPGFAKGLIGAAAGETRTLPVAFPADFRVPSLAGKSASYAVQVKAIREKVRPPADPEFLKRFDVESEDALRAKVRRQLAEAAERSEKERQKSDIIKYLLDNTQFDLPQTVVDEETDLAIRGMVRRIVMDGGTREQVREMRESIVNAATRSAAERVKVSYILSRIASEEKIDVADGEADRRIDAMAKEYGMPPEKMRAELEKRNGMESLKSDIRAEKTLDVLLGSAKVN